MLEKEEEKYHCRFCGKGFSNGRALRGHMQVHGMFNESILHPNESPFTIGAEGDSSNGNCLPTSHVCQNCREEFCSLKSLSKHCCRGLIGASKDDGENDNSNGLFPPSLPRSKTPTQPLVLTEEERAANCLVMLSTSRANPIFRNTGAAECSTSVLRITDAKECSTSEKREVDYVVLPHPFPQPEGPKPHISTQTPSNARKLFECKTCQKVFTSHQALGGHRASHKKVEGYFATRPKIRSPKMMKFTSTEDENNNRNHQNNQAMSSSENMTLAIVSFLGTSSQFPLPNEKPKEHECSICKRQFSSGQALGGHMRCHWRASSSHGATVEPLSVVATELQEGNSSSGLNGIHPHTLMFRSLISTPNMNMRAPINDFPEATLRLDMPSTTMYVQPGWENARENALNVNIEEVESREVRLNDLSDLININEKKIWIPTQSATM
ncbi:Zinc finger protein ZAT3 [Dendrobium catenatum]|uniref:Zinc finger protein ZAT3 n=1 Tax=Dendrobium catenatum TaxID=906689 RepID=A0A2I0XHZ9_9ASPA|nr:Zinc finger protein ZAT3 [Dendrobium catenatum]